MHADYTHTSLAMSAAAILACLSGQLVEYKRISNKSHQPSAHKSLILTKAA